MWRLPPGRRAERASSSMFEVLAAGWALNGYTTHRSLFLGVLDEPVLLLCDCPLARSLTTWRRLSSTITAQRKRLAVGRPNRSLTLPRPPKFKMDNPERLIRSADGPGGDRWQSRPVPCLSSADEVLAGAGGVGADYVQLAARQGATRRLHSGITRRVAMAPCASSACAASARPGQRRAPAMRQFRHCLRSP
jgi:hypothetical protein